MKHPILAILSLVTAAASGQQKQPAKPPQPKIKTTSVKQPDGTYNTSTNVTCPKAWKVYFSPESLETYNADLTPEALIVLLSQATCVPKPSGQQEER